MKIVPVTLTEKPAGSFYARKQNRSAAASWKTQSLRWDRGAAARVCTDVPTPLENTLNGGGGWWIQGGLHRTTHRPEWKSLHIFWIVLENRAYNSPHPPKSSPGGSATLPASGPALSVWDQDFVARSSQKGPTSVWTWRRADPKGPRWEAAGGRRRWTRVGDTGAPPLFPQHCSDSMKPSFSWPTGSTSA